MTVADASVMVRLLTGADQLAPKAKDILEGRLHVPQIFLAEVTSGLRGLLLRRLIGPDEASTSRQRLRSARLRLHPYDPYADRIWELRNNLSIYDSWYVAVAERLRQPLITVDTGILQAPGLRCELIDAREGRQSL